MAWTTPKTNFNAGDVLTAAEMNAIGANLDVVGGAWTTYTPQLRQGTTNLTSTATYAKYRQVNKTVMVQVQLTCTQNGAAGQNVNISHPSGLTPVNTGSDSVIGTFTIKDGGTAFYVGLAYANGGYIYGTASGAVSSMGSSTPNFTLAANNDTVAFTVVYEIA